MKKFANIIKKYKIVCTLLLIFIILRKTYTEYMDDYHRKDYKLGETWVFHRLFDIKIDTKVVFGKKYCVNMSKTRDTDKWIEAFNYYVEHDGSDMEVIDRFLKSEKLSFDMILDRPEDISLMLTYIDVDRSGSNDKEYNVDNLERKLSMIKSEYIDNKDNRIQSDKPEKRDSTNDIIDNKK